jgi:hypothetical protein
LVRAANWYHEFAVSLRVIWGWLRLPRGRPTPEAYVAVRTYALNIANAFSVLPTERAKRHLLALASLVAEEGWPSIALELAHRQRAVVPPVWETYYRWMCGDVISAARLLIDTVLPDGELPDWAPLLLAAFLLQDGDDGRYASCAHSVLGPRASLLVARLKQDTEDLLEPQEAADILRISRDCPRQFHQGISQFVFRYGYAGLVSAADLSDENAALWYLLNADFRHALQCARKALASNKALAIPRLVLASLWLCEQPHRAARVTERLLYPELTHGYLDTEQHVAKHLAKAIKQAGTSASWRDDVNDAIQTCIRTHDVPLLHLVAHIAWCMGEPSWSEEVLSVLENWRVEPYLLLQR